MRLWWVCEKLVDLVVWLLDYWLLRSSVQYIKHHLHSQHYYIYFIVIFSIITYQILFSQGQHYYISNTLLYRISWTLLCGETIKWPNLYSCRQLVSIPSIDVDIALIRTVLFFCFRNLTLMNLSRVSPSLEPVHWPIFILSKVEF